MGPCLSTPLCGTRLCRWRVSYAAIARLEQKLLESTDEFGDTPIIKACRRGHVEVTSFLLEQGANIDARNEDGYTALMLACYWEQLPVVDLLLRHGADAGLTSNNGALALSLPPPPVGALSCLTIRAPSDRGVCRPHML